ncbi:TonB-dependent receptor [Pedobacter chitinilyticus]|uniref:TonB-dependent siderophore receptor n=1 Tax=Pedobacter chitinilyticus TaxID=2233776 RepID=A0A443YVA1_9SPHI|nr:TonB-dependent receptor [Pedobacter chitinilyticus]RWU07716.1 TonB-dependent siderophore receptor [Pedobacter chitinilyticus]
MKTKFTSMLCVYLLLAVFSITVFAQKTKSTLSGTVKTNDGSAASHVTVSLKSVSTQTDENGRFIFRNLTAGTYQLRISAVGIKTMQIEVRVKEGENETNTIVIAESASQLQEVAISAYKSSNSKPTTLGKVAIPPRDLPQSVQIITNQVIRDQQVDRLGDVMRNVNGVALGANRGGVGENFYARGYSLGSNNIFKNGARTSIGGSPEASTLESVEVLKGSAALLYGGVTGGAVVNMVTKKPRFDRTGGEASFRTGSYDQYKGIVDFYTPLDEKVAIRLIATGEEAGSFRDNVKSKRVYVNPSLLYKVNDKTEILLQGDYLNSDFTPDFGLGTIGNKLNSLGRNVFINTNWAYNKTNTATGQLVLNHKFNNDWKLNVNISIQSYDRDYFSAERPAADANGFWNRVLTRSNIKELTFNQQINLTGGFKTAGIKHILLVGADADQSKTTSGGFASTNVLPVVGVKTYYDRVNISDPSSFNQPSNFNMPNTTLLTNTDAEVFRIGGFVQDLVALTTQFKVLAGVRWSFQKTPTTTINTVATGVETKGTVKDKIDKAFSPKFGLIYEPFKTTSLYVSYANNFTSNSGTDIATNGPMGPSIIDQYEAGVKNDFLEGKLSVNLTVYKIKNDKFAQTALADPTKREFSGATASDGVEVDLSGVIVKGLNFLAGYSYNYMRYTSTLATSGIVEGERLVGTTKNTANATIFYTLQNGAIKGLKLGASAFYTGDRNGGRNTTKNGSSSGIIPLKGFTTIDLSAGYSWKKLSLLGKLSNITNELNYFVHENYSVNPIPPRQFLTTLSYKF